MKTISLLSLCFVLGACGGSVASVDDQQRPPGSVESDGQREPSDTSPAEATSPSQPAAPSCSAVPIPVTGTDSCAVAREHLVVEGVKIEWQDGSAWRKDAVATFTIRYRNTAANSGIHYPGVKVFSSDARVRTSTEDHGDPFVHPDYYMIAECSSQEADFQRLRVVADVPSGTKISLRLEPAVATGNGIDSCGDTLAKTVFDVVVP